MSMLAFGSQARTVFVLTEAEKNWAACVNIFPSVGIIYLANKRKMPALSPDIFREWQRVSATEKSGAHE
jgi:hypothetical protein